MRTTRTAFYSVPLMLFGLGTALQAGAQVNFEAPMLHSRILTRMDAAIRAGDYEQITSVLVAREGRLLFEGYYNGADSSSRHNTRSATKTIAALATGFAIDDGSIASADDPIKKYLGHRWPVRHPDSRKDSITIEDLLTMSSVLECNDGNQYSRGNEERMYLIEDWTQFLLDLPVRAYPPWELPPAERAYGRAFSYCTAGAATMAVVVESAVGEPLDAYLKRKLFTPLGIEAYTLHYNPQGTLNTAGGSEYRSRDFLKLIQLYLRGGTWAGERIISADWLTEATSPKAVPREAVEYGYLMWLKEFGPQGHRYPAYYMSGNGGQKVLGVPALDLAVVITTTNYGNGKAHGYTDALMNEFIVPAVAPE